MEEFLPMLDLRHGYLLLVLYYQRNMSRVYEVLMRILVMFSWCWACHGNHFRDG
jgi:hypothetical protein